MKYRMMAIASMLGGLTLSTNVAFANGLLLVPGPNGNLEYQDRSTSFSRHYGSGGKPIIPEAQSQASSPPMMTLLQEPDEPRVQTRRVVGRPNIISAIEEVGMRYAGHPALRKSRLSVNDWLALFRANVEIESAYNPNARSHVGAIGLGQLMPATAAKLGVNPHDVHENLDGSARYLLMLLGQFGSKELALAGYNAGPGAVQKYGGIPPYKETQGHVVKVVSVFNRLKNGDRK